MAVHSPPFPLSFSLYAHAALPYCCHPPPSLPQASLSFSEVKDKVVTPFSTVAKLMPEQFITESSDAPKDTETTKAKSGDEHKKFAKWSLRWFLSGMLHPR